MTQESLKQAIAAAQQRLESLLNRATGDNSTELLQEAIAELSDSLEELQVAAEELEAQNEELTATREAVETERQRYQDLFNFTPDGYLVTDAAGTIQAANPGAAQLLNTKQSYLVGKPLAVFVHPEQRQKFRQILAQLRQKDQIQRAEVWMFHSLRKIDFPSELTGAAMQDTEGKLVSLCFLVRDISDRQQAQEKQAQSEHLLRTIIQSEPECVKLLARDGTLLDMNPAGLAMIEADSLAQVQGRSIYHLVASDDCPAFQALTERVFQGESGILEFEVLGLKGTRRCLETHAVPFRNTNGNIVAALSVTRNISERQAALRERKRVETALSQKEEQLRLITDGLPAYISYVDASQQYQFVNKMYELRFGMPREQICGRHIREILGEDTYKFLQGYIEQVLAGNSITYETAKPHPQLGTQYMYATLIPDIGQDDQVKGWYNLILDITERKHLELALQESEAKLRDILNNAIASIVSIRVFSDGTWEYDYYSPSCEAVFGFTAAEMMAGIWWSRIPPEDQQSIIIPAQQYIFAQQPTRIEYRFRHKDGNLRWICSDISSRWDEENLCFRVIAVDLDISDRQIVEDKLAKISTALSNAVEGISYLDTQGRYVTVNQAYANMVGYSPAEMVGMLWYPTVHTEDLEMMQAAYQQMLSNGKVEVEARGIRKDGSMFYKQLVMVAAYDEQKQLTGHYCFMKDISDRKQAEFALQRQFQQQQALNRVMQAIRNSLDLTTIFNTATAEFTQLFSAAGSYIVQYLSERQVWQIVAEYHQDPQVPNTIGFEIPDEANPIANRLKQLEVVQISDTNKLEDEVNREIAKTFSGSWLMIPLNVGGTVWGSLNLYSYEQVDSDSANSQIELARAVADQLAIAIQQANLYQQLQQELIERQQAQIQLQKQAQQKELLNQVIQGIRSSLDLNVIFQTATAEIAQLSLAEESYIIQYFPEQQIWRVVAGYRENSEITDKIGTEFPHTENLISQKIIQSEIFQISDSNLLEDEINKELAQIYPGAWLIVPLVVGESLWGCFSLIDSQTNTIWNDEQVELARALADQLAIAIQQANLYQQLQQELSDRKQAEIELQKAKEAAETANVAKSTFLANMSHELRTPLNAILGFTQMMARDRTLSAPQQEQVKIINNAGDHLLGLINDILEMSKIEAGRTSFHSTSFDLINLLFTLEELFQLKAESKNLQLRFELVPDLPQYIQTDEGKLRQVLINIIGNAIKFTDKGQVTLRAKPINQLEPPNYQLIFEIEDTGPGINSEEIDRIFDPFTQSESEKKVIQGTGLGLAISRKFVQMMGGKIRVSSQPNKGSVFTFDIQVTPAEAVEKNPQETPNKIVGIAPNQPEYRILVVDDHPESRLLLVTLLSSIGFQVSQTYNGQEAVSIWSTWKPHLICMDIRMPVMDGIQATAQIRAKEKELCDSSVITNYQLPMTHDPTIIIALTANAFDEDKNSALSAGCDDYISKPLQQDMVLQKIGQYLEIAYLYECDRHPTKTINQNLNPTKLTINEIKKNLVKMPEEWLATLHKNAYIGNDSVILELIKQIPPEDAQIAKALIDLTNNFEFDKIIELTQE